MNSGLRDIMRNRLDEAMDCIRWVSRFQPCLSPLSENRLSKATQILEGLDTVLEFLPTIQQTTAQEKPMNNIDANANANAKAKLVQKSPWQSYFHKLVNLFSGDPGIEVKQSGDGADIHFYFQDEQKMEALNRILGPKAVFGNFVVSHHYHLPNAMVAPAAQEDYKVLFEGNHNVSRVVEGGNPVIGKRTYVVFKPEVVQWFDDNLMDVNGNRSTLMEDIAREVFDQGFQQGASFCTEKVK
jgi:hypothetical protein